MDDPRHLLAQAELALGESRWDEALRLLGEAQALIRARRDRPDPSFSSQPLPDRFTLHVDGVGSFRIFLSPRISIGPAGASPQPDLPLLADASIPTISIERFDEDYFLESRTAVAVNDAPTMKRLLNDGDRIALSPRIRLTFRLPHPASASALIQISGVRLPKGDIRAAVMLDRELILGPGPQTHIRADDLSEPAFLKVAQGRLYCRSSEVTINGQPGGPSAEVGLGTHALLGPVGFIAALE